MSKRLHKVLQDLTGQSGEEGFIIEGDEWWLKPERSEENETREEWKARTFSMHYGHQNTESENEGVAEATIRMLGRLKRGEPLIPGFSPRSISGLLRSGRRVDPAEPRSEKESNPMEPTRPCPKCNGSQMLVIPARNDTPPEKALGGFMHLGCVIKWIVWCDCKDGWV